MEGKRQRARGTGGKAFTAVFLGMNGQGREAGLGWTGLNNFIDLWSVGAAFSCPMPSPGMIKAM